MAARFFPDDIEYVKCCFECANIPNCKHGNKREYQISKVSEY